jgi:hypothetical protein
VLRARWLRRREFLRLEEARHLWPAFRALHAGVAAAVTATTATAAQPAQPAAAAAAAATTRGAAGLRLGRPRRLCVQWL